MTPHLAMIGYGAVTAVGFDAAQTCAAVRAGLSGFRESGFLLRRKRFTPLIGAAVQYEMPATEDGPSNRLARMASDAITECVDQASLTPGRTAILLGVRERVAALGVEGPDLSELLSSVEMICGATFHRESALMPHSSCAIATGLVQAARLLAAGTVDACVVGGVDSFLTDEDIERYDRLARLKSPDNARGFIPGEAAAVVAVTIDRTPVGLPCILGVGLAQEDESRTAISDGHPTGKALTAALSAAARDAAVEEQAFAFRVSDLNGETYSAQDSILGAHRFYRTLRPDFTLMLPAASVGETGAAAGALGVLVAGMAIVRGYAPGRVAMCQASSDGGLRSGVVLGVLR